MSQSSTLSGTTKAYPGFTVEFGAVLGKGSFGVVYGGLFSEAQTSHSQRIVAMKTEPTHRRRNSLIREARLYENLPESPYLCQCFKSFRTSDTRILVLEKMGPSLKALSRTYGPLPAECVALIAIDILHGLEALHSAGFVHRDLKPGNICLDMTCFRAKLIDFGLAGPYLDPDESHPSDPAKARFVGTVAYASRNALQEFRQSRRDDMESLVFVLLELLRGDMPWGERFKRKLTTEEESMYRRVTLDVKSLYVPDTLFPQEQYPAAFAKFMRMVGHLKYKAVPKYRLYRKSFEQIGEDSVDNRKRWFPWLSARALTQKQAARRNIAVADNNTAVKTRRWIRTFQRRSPNEYGQILRELSEDQRRELRWFLSKKAETKMLSRIETYLAVNGLEYREVEKLFVMRKMSFSKAVFREMNIRGFDGLRELAERYVLWKASLQL